MKKIFLAFLLVLLIAALTACAQPAADDPEQPQNTSEPADNTAGENAETPADTAEPPADEQNPADSGAEQGEAATPEVQTGAGSYTGQADSNFIEIKVSGLAEEEAYKVFMLSQDIKDRFDSLGLETGDQVSFEYYVNENAQNVLIEIEKN